MPNADGHNPRVIVIGASAGGVEALSYLASQLPADLGASVFVVLHLPHNATSMMPAIMRRAGKLTAVNASVSEPIKDGVIYIAPPDKHMILRDGEVFTVFGPRENGHRPSIDPLFRSAAEAYGSGAIGIVLTGNLDDGTAGLASIKSCGGIAIVQDPEEAAHKGMPQSAIENVAVDQVLKLDQIAPAILQLLAEPAPETGNGMGEDNEREIKAAELDPEIVTTDPQDGVPSGLTCPECNGALWEVKDGRMVRYRCRVGHAYSSDSMLHFSSTAVEAALWAALRSLQENASFARRLEKRAGIMGSPRLARRYAEQAARATEHALTLRTILTQGPLGSEAETEEMTAPE